MSTISKETFKFLKQLALNNNRPWFEKNRPQYEKARAEYVLFITKLLHGIRKIEMIPEKEPVKYVQRIYRDIRFSKDKTPYKKFLSSLILRGPEDRKCPMYVQLMPGRSMVGGGVWDPSPEGLKMIRQEIDYNGTELRKIVLAKHFIKQFDKIQGEKLARPPRGYEADNPHIEFLQFKQFFVRHAFDDDLVLSKHLVPEILKSYKTAMPFFRFFDDALLGE